MFAPVLCYTEPRYTVFPQYTGMCDYSLIMTHRSLIHICSTGDLKQSSSVHD